MVRPGKELIDQDQTSFEELQRMKSRQLSDTEWNGLVHGTRFSQDREDDEYCAVAYGEVLAQAELAQAKVKSMLAPGTKWAHQKATGGPLTLRAKCNSDPGLAESGWCEHVRCSVFREVFINF